MQVKLTPLEEITTTEGSMFPIYRDWDEWHDGHVPKMAYITTMKAGTSKGPILHHKRTAYITAVTGDVLLEVYVGGRYRDPVDSKEYPEINKFKLRANGRSLVAMIPPGAAISLHNQSNETATIINLPSPAWHPDDPDTEKFGSWEEYFEKVNT